MTNTFGQEAKRGDILIYSDNRVMTLGVFRGSSVDGKPVDNTDDNIHFYQYRGINMRTVRVWWYTPYTYDYPNRRYIIHHDRKEIKIQKSSFRGGVNHFVINDYILFNTFDRELANKVKEVQQEVLEGKHGK